MQKILVVDDQAAVAELIKLKLEKVGFEVIAALDGVEGLNTLRKFKPDLIILDVLMPGIDGYQFYKRLKEQPETKNIPVLVMTARGAMKESFEGLGVESFLAKPFEPDELLRQVESILKSAAKENQPLQSFSKRKENPFRKIALVAGCEPDKILTMRQQLEEKGYWVETVKNGPEALKRALSLIPQLFVLQHDLPGMNAEEIVKVLHALPEGKKISVVVFAPLKDKKDAAPSSWNQFLSRDKKKELHGQEAPLKVVEKFDKDTFLDKIKDFL